MDIHWHLSLMEVKLEVVPMVLMDTVFDKSGKPEELSMVFNKMISTWHSGYRYLSYFIII
jgi:hypothetical protein